MHDLLTMGRALGRRDEIPQAPWDQDWPMIRFEVGEILMHAKVVLEEPAIGPLRPRRARGMTQGLREMTGEFLKETNLPWDYVRLKFAKFQRVRSDGYPHWCQLAVAEVAQRFHFEVPPLDHEWWDPARERLRDDYGIVEPRKGDGAHEEA